MILPENLALWLAQSKAQADVPLHSLHSRIVSLIEEVRRLRARCDEQEVALYRVRGEAQP